MWWCQVEQQEQELDEAYDALEAELRQAECKDSLPVGTHATSNNDILHEADLSWKAFYWCFIQGQSLLLMPS